MQTQLAEQTRLYKEQVDGLLDDRRIHMTEFDSRKARDQDKIQMLTEKYVVVVVVVVVVHTKA